MTGGGLVIILPAGVFSIHSAEKQLILQVLDKTNWNISRSARLLCIARQTLYHKMDRYGIVDTRRAEKRRRSRRRFV